MNLLFSDTHSTRSATGRSSHFLTADLSYPHLLRRHFSASPNSHHLQWRLTTGSGRWAFGMFIMGAFAFAHSNVFKFIFCDRHGVSKFFFSAGVFRSFSAFATKVIPGSYRCHLSVVHSTVETSREQFITRLSIACITRINAAWTMLLLIDWHRVHGYAWCRSLLCARSENKRRKSPT